MPNEAALTVDIPQLRIAIDGLLATVQERFGARVAIDADHYWLLELPAAFSPDLREPTPDDFAVGQISDDIESVAETVRALGDPDEWVTLWHDLEHAVGLLRALAWTDLPKGL